MRKTIKTTLATLMLSLLMTFSAFAQKIDTVSNQNGNIAYRYPFDMYFQAKDLYFIDFKFSKYKKMIYDFYLKNNQNAKNQLSYKEFKRNIKRFTKQLHHNVKGLDYQIKKAVIANPYPLIETRYSLETDIKPCLDKIPDGVYYQYFAPFIYLNSKGVYEIKSDVVAGKFHIKNNTLDGEAMWFNIHGDTLKQGYYINGLKEGVWKLEQRDFKYRMNTKEFRHAYIKNGAPEVDTNILIVTYKGGVKNGYYKEYSATKYPLYEGVYENNIRVGSWIERKSNEIYNDNEDLISVYDNKIITEKYTYEKNSPVVKQPIIRQSLLVGNDLYHMDYNFESVYSPVSLFNRLVALNYGKDENSSDESYESPEVEEDYYEGDEEYDEEYYEEEEFEGDYEGDYYSEEYSGDTEESDSSIYQNSIYLPKLKKYVPLSYLIDSIGYRLNYTGLYEKYYPNGQLMIRLFIKDGKIEKEDTIFWDNGKAMDVIEFRADSNLYQRSIYDYDGKLYLSILYNQKGDYFRTAFKSVDYTYVMIDGLKVKDAPEDNYFFYNMEDSVKYFTQKDSVLLFQSWSKLDTTVHYKEMYYPIKRELKEYGYGTLNKLSYTTEKLFGDNFDNWTGTSYTYFGDYMQKDTESATYIGFGKDSNAINRITMPYQFFDVNAVPILYKNNQLMNGEVTIKFNTNKPKFKNNKFCYPASLFFDRKLAKDFERYSKKGKTKYPELVNESDFYNFESTIEFNHLYSSLFSFISNYVVDSYLYDESMYGKRMNFIRRHKVRNNSENYTAKIIGTFAEGRPNGVWKIYDNRGDLVTEVPFKNGEIEGVVKTYNTALPYNESIEPDFDTLPKKNVYFLESVETYKNGIKNGESIVYNWLGEVLVKENYKDGYRHGDVLERNRLAYTKSHFEEGSLDGYVQTYLTLKDKDTSLLYRLNFQNGRLQGESNAYHINGQLAKKGFFLDGQAIDDYEAYDTLGFKYHYVKFQYGYPVEEKIWEENQLSIRYLFDWKDSIIFRPTDITESQSLDHILAKLGIGMEYYSRPYYGRPSLVDKDDVKYQLTKYYANDSIARDGFVKADKKVGHWKYYNYYGRLLYEIDYFDSLVKINDTISFNSKGIYFEYDTLGVLISKSFIIEKFEKYDCSHSDHYEIRQFYTFWEASGKSCINGYVKHHYDNGTLQSEGQMKNGLPVGVWKFYDPFGNLNQVGLYVNGKRDGRWLGGDLSKTKYLGDICLNPNLPDLEETIKEREQQLDITITNYKMGKAMNREFYDIDWSQVERKEKKENQANKEEGEE